MDERSEMGPGQVEWLDLGPPERPDEPGPPRRSRRPWYLLAAAIAVAALLVAALNHDPKHSTATASHPPTAATTIPATSVSTAPSPTSSPSVAVTNAGHRLLAVPAGWVLFARAPDSVVRIELAKGRVTTTAVPELGNDSGVSFVVEPDRVFALTLGDQRGYEVLDGHAARALPAAFGRGPVLPGPDSRHVWVATGTGAQSVMTLVGFDGRRVGPSIRVPEGVGTAEPDGAGYVRFDATGGVYDARPDGVKRITTGDLLAIGSTRWLTEDCDAEFRCATTVTDRISGGRHTVAKSDGNYSFGGYSDGVIAPDGSVAALIKDGGPEGQLTVDLLDLSTGDLHATDIAVNPDQAFSGSDVLAWSPDSRWLFIAADGGRVVVLDRTSMRAAALSAALPFISQVALRSG